MFAREKRCLETTSVGEATYWTRGDIKGKEGQCLVGDLYSELSPQPEQTSPLVRVSQLTRGCGLPWILESATAWRSASTVAPREVPIDTLHTDTDVHMGRTVDAQSGIDRKWIWVRARFPTLPCTRSGQHPCPFSGTHSSTPILPFSGHSFVY